MKTVATRKLVLPLLVSGILVIPSLALSATVTVDGDLTDLFNAQAGNPAAPFNSASGTDSGVDGDGPGFDITNTYAYYDGQSDTFFLGMSFAGQVGTSGGQEGISAFCIQPAGGFNSGIAGNFDACETYGIGIDINNDSSFELDYRLTGDALVDSGTGTEHTLGSPINPNGVTVNWAVSEAFNAVEFSVTGFENLLNPMSPTNPRDILINFYAGSTSNFGPEDIAPLNMQVVPVPAAVWLFGSGLIGLVGFATNKKGKGRGAS